MILTTARTLLVGFLVSLNPTLGIADEIDDLNAITTEECTLVQANGLMQKVGEFELDQRDAIEAALKSLQLASDLGDRASELFRSCLEEEASNFVRTESVARTEETVRREIKCQIDSRRNAIGRIFSQINREDTRVAQYFKKDLEDRVFHLDTAQDHMLLRASECALGNVAAVLETMLSGDNEECEGME